MTAAGGQVYVGDSAGTLRVLDPASSAQSSSFGWSIVAQLPAPGASSPPPVVAGPVGSETVVYAVYGSGVQEVRFFTPGTGQVATLATGQTSVSSLSRDLAAGVVYAGGDASWNASDHAAGQVFAIRADALASAVGAFIADPAPSRFRRPAGGAGHGGPRPRRPVPDPPHGGRLDGRPNAAASGTAVKVWADAPTSVTINGQPFQIGPGPALTDAAAVETGADGVVTIVGDATDFSTPALRVWAPFMDPSERVVIYPDQEFHLRLAGCTAQTSDAGLDFGTINLGTCATYDGTQTADQPAAGLVPGQRRHLRDGRRGVRSSRPAQLALARAPIALQGAGPGDSPARYLAYGDLPGAAYAPVASPAGGGPSPPARPGSCWTPPAGSPSPPPRRRPADALAGSPPTDMLLTGSIGDWFRPLWDDVKNDVRQLSRSSSA